MIDGVYIVQGRRTMSDDDEPRNGVFMYDEHRGKTFRYVYFRYPSYVEKCLKEYSPDCDFNRYFRAMKSGDIE
jgi:hypothetical protein